MPKIRGNPTDKWNRRTSAATQDYEAGIKNPRVDWQQATLAASQTHTAAVQQAIADNRFARGVQASSSARWSEKASGKGAARFAGGVSDAVADYQAGVQPYLDVISNLNLPARGPKGDPKNIQRVSAIASALHKKKIGK